VSKDKILVVEDAADIASLLKIYFTSQGYDVMTAMRGQMALEICRKTPPSLALLDVNLPDMEGYEIGKVLRQSPRTRHIPIIFLTARGERQDRLKGLGEVQADDYIVKPFDIEEVNLIVRNNLAKARQKNLTHPVTNLPTAELINEQLRSLLGREGWGLGLVHINGFEVFTQSYGAVVGEDVLKFTALLISEVVNEVGTTDDFVGQMITGPDFALTATPERLRQVAERLAERFDAEIGLHYNYRDRRNGYITVLDEQGHERQMPLMSLSGGVLSSADGPFYDIRELSEAVEETRHLAVSEARERGLKSHFRFGRA
jgi:DNA-binding response OmpR family regulator